MHKINQYFRTASTWQVILIFTVACIIISGVTPLLETWGIPDIHFFPTPDELPIGFVGMLILAVAFAPLVETLFFQLIPFKLLSKIRFMRENPIWIIIISALIFGMLHYYSIHYMIATFFMGMIFMYVYIIRTGKCPYVTVLIIQIGRAHV